jgi:hypothetical protein
MPAVYRKRLFQGLTAYGALLLMLGGFVAAQNDGAKKYWDERVPQITSEVRQVYLNPQLTDVTEDGFAGNPNDLYAAGQSGSILLVMSDIGLDKALDERALNDTPNLIAMAITPYSPRAAVVAAAAKAQSRDIITMIPMEPNNYPKDDPGPQALLSNLGPEENQAVLTRLLAAVPGSSAAMNFMGSRYLGERKNMDMFLRTLKASNLSFIETPVAPLSTTFDLAKETGARALAVDIVIDEKATEQDIRYQLGELERLSRQQGFAVGHIRPYPLTFTLIKDWLPTLEKRKLRLVPLSEGLTLNKKPAQATMQPAAAELPPQPIEPMPDTEVTDAPAP